MDDLLTGSVRVPVPEEGRSCRTSGEEGLTAAGLLFFGKLRPILDNFPNYFLDYQERGPYTGAIEWSHRFYTDGTWSGNLLDFFLRVSPRLAADVKVPFQLDTTLMRVDDTHVRQALREALANTLIHADYEARVGVLVVKDRAGFSFRNPGGLRLSREQIFKGGISDGRNRTLQRMFLLLGFGEQVGSGFSRILRAWREQTWRAPLLSESVEPEFTSLELPTVSLLPEEVVAALEGQLGPRFQGLTPPQRLAVITAEMEGRVSNSRLQELTTEHPSDLTRCLTGLAAAGLLEQRGARRGSYYVRPGRQVTLWSCLQNPEAPEPCGEPSVLSGSSSVHLPPTSEPSEGTVTESSEQSSVRSVHLGQQGTGDSVHLPPRSVHVGGGSTGDSVHLPYGPEPPSESSERLQRLMATTRSVRETGKAARTRIEEAILQVCLDDFLGLNELSQLLGRTQSTLRIHYLARMVAEGRLELRFPRTPNHPQQAYRTARSETSGKDNP